MCGVMMSWLAGSARCASTARGATAPPTAKTATAMRRRSPVIHRAEYRAKRPNDLMKSALEEQRFEQGRQEEERGEAEQRGAGRQSERFHDHERVDSEHDKAQ